MALQDSWPIWGNSGSQPNDGQEYQESSSPEAFEFNYLWTEIRDTFASVESRLNSLEGHGASQHDTDQLHNDAVGFPTYQSESDVPSIAEGEMVLIEQSDGSYGIYVENGQ